MPHIILNRKVDFLLHRISSPSSESIARSTEHILNQNKTNKVRTMCHRTNNHYECGHSELVTTRCRGPWSTIIPRRCRPGFKLPVDKDAKVFVPAAPFRRRMRRGRGSLRGRRSCSVRESLRISRLRARFRDQQSQSLSNELEERYQ